MEFASTFVRGCRQGQQGLRERLRRGAVTLALLTLALCALSPAEASAHAGEVHSDAPEAAAPARGPGEGGDGERGNAGGRKGSSTESTGVDAEDGTKKAEIKAAPASTPPPPPEEPDSDPMLHFAALGVAVVAGLGLLLVRRRRLDP
jgi:LPXTG-motif cell wall-anchored protein